MHGRLHRNTPPITPRSKYEISVIVISKGRQAIVGGEGERGEGGMRVPGRVGRVNCGSKVVRTGRSFPPTLDEPGWGTRCSLFRIRYSRS